MGWQDTIHAFAMYVDVVKELCGPSVVPMCPSTEFTIMGFDARDETWGNRGSGYALYDRPSRQTA